MAMRNFTVHRDGQWYEQRYCTAEVTAGIHFQLASISVINIFLSVTAFLGNILILVALQKASSLRTPSKVLFRCLAMSDLGVGIVAEPLFVTYLISVVNEQWNICRYVSATIFIAGYTLSGVSLLTLTAISVDRLLALLLGLRYRQVVTLKRTYLIAAVFWILSIFVGTMYFWNKVMSFWASSIVALFCLVASGISYTKIFLDLRHRQAQVQGSGQQWTIPQNTVRYRKAVSGAIWVQLMLTVCYIPYVVWAIFALKQKELSSSIVVSKYITLTLAFLNSSLNPILYCWKMKEVRQAVKETIRQKLCSPSS